MRTYHHHMRDSFHIAPALIAMDGRIPGPVRRAARTTLCRMLKIGEGG